MNSFRKLLLGFMVLIGLVLCAGLHVRARAQEKAGQALQVSPVLVELNAVPGGTYNIQLELTNVSAGTLNLEPSVNDFRAKDETGTPEIIFDNVDGAASYSFKQWVADLPEIQLEPKEKRKIEVKVTVPQDVEPGGHYGVIRYSGSAPEVVDSGVALSASIGVLVLARIDGDVNESLKTESFHIEQAGKSRRWLEKPPVSFVARIRNDGNVHLKPKGDIIVKNMFGKEVAEIPVNADDRHILPDSIRRFEYELGSGLSIGRYTADMNLAYGTTGQVLQATHSFWVIPYKLILLSLAIAAVIIFSLVKLVKRYNKMIIERAKKQSDE